MEETSRSLTPSIEGFYPANEEDSRPLWDILIVDDEKVLRMALARTLKRNNYLVEQAENGLEALKILEQKQFRLIISDLVMPDLDGMALLTEVRRRFLNMPFIFMTAHATVETAVQATRLGAYDYLIKPFEKNALLLSAQRAIEKFALENENNQLMEKLAGLNLQLEDKVNERTSELKRALAELNDNLLGTIQSLASAIDARDKYTIGHSRRVAQLSQLIAENLGLPEDEIGTIVRGATLHDIGKIGIEDRILHKPGELTPEEYRIITRHPEIGANITASVKSLEGERLIIRYHHERPDGTGYPEGLRGTRIPRHALIVGVADTFDAITSNRPYRRGVPVKRAVEILCEVSGTQHHPECVNALIAQQEQARAIILNRE